jgi:HAD superfamily hydrolase (TIGR01509 family)
MAVLGLTETDADLMMAELWDAYCGELDRELYDFFASLRDGYLLGILSNSMDGARREEGRRYGFPDLVDVLVYSHEVGVAKPDPRAYALTTERLGVAPDEVLFLDNAEPNVTAARAFGWHAVHHLTTAESIVQMRLQLGSG